MYNILTDLKHYLNYFKDQKLCISKFEGPK